MVAVPPVGVTRPSSMRRVVVLPAPLGPRKPVTEPGSTVKLRSSTARTWPKFLDRPDTTIRPGWSTTGLPPVRDRCGTSKQRGPTEFLPLRVDAPNHRPVDYRWCRILDRPYP